MQPDVIKQMGSFIFTANENPIYEYYDIYRCSAHGSEYRTRPTNPVARFSCVPGKEGIVPAFEVGGLERVRYTYAIAGVYNCVPGVSNQCESAPEHLPLGVHECETG